VTLIAREVFAVFFSKEFGTVRRKCEMGLCLGLGVLLGLGVAAYRSFLPGQAALAQEQAKKDRAASSRRREPPTAVR
jgi:hypothetical protein